MNKSDSIVTMLKVDDNLEFRNLRAEAVDTDTYKFFSLRFCSLGLKMKYSVLGGWWKAFCEKRVHNLVIGEIKDVFPTWHLKISNKIEKMKV